MSECQYTTTLSSFLPGVLGTERAVQLRDELAWLKEQDLMPPNYVQFTTSSGAIKFRKPESKWLGGRGAMIQREQRERERREERDCLCVVCSV